MNLEKILQSKILKSIALVGGILSAIAKIVDIVLPDAAQLVISGLLILVVVYAVYLFIDAIKEEVEKIAPLTPPEQAYQYFATRYGIGYESLQVQWAISQDGSATVQRIVEVQASSTIKQLDSYLLIPESSHDNAKPRNINFKTVESLTKGWTVVLTDSKTEMRHRSALITISPPLSKGEKIRYKLIEQLPVGLYAINFTKAQLSAREEEYDYCGWNINRPTRKVSLEVELPQYVKPNVFSAEVRYASASGFASVRTHYEEEQKFRPVLTLGPKGDRYVLRLDVDYPMIGLIYILRWLPVPSNN